MKIRANSINLATLSLILLGANSAFAQDGKWAMRGLPSYFSTASGERSVTSVLPPPTGQETTSQGIEDAFGFGFSLEYLLGERIGFEVAAFLSDHDTEMTLVNDLGTFTATDSTGFRTFSLGANYHFKSEGRVRWSLGGFVPWIYVDPTDHVFPGLSRTEHRYYDQDYGIGVKGAMDWSFAADSPWSLVIEGRYMALLIMESETVGDVDVDPLVLSIGIGYRF